MISNRFKNLKLFNMVNDLFMMIQIASHDLMNVAGKGAISKRGKTSPEMFLSVEISQ